MKQLARNKYCVLCLESFLLLVFPFVAVMHQRVREKEIWNTERNRKCRRSCKNSLTKATSLKSVQKKDTHRVKFRCRKLKSDQCSAKLCREQIHNPGPGLEGHYLSGADFDFTDPVCEFPVPVESEKNYVARNHSWFSDLCRRAVIEWPLKVTRNDLKIITIMNANLRRHYSLVSAEIELL